MRDTVYLVLNADGVVRMTKRWPTLAREEVGVQVKVSIPDDSFKSPVVGAKLDIPPDRVIQPELTVEVGDASPPRTDPTPP